MDPTNDSPDDLGPDQPLQDCVGHEGPGSLRATFESLVECLSAIRDGPPLPETSEVESWKDQEYLYLELEAPDPHALLSDTCIIEGRIHIRIHR